MGVHFMSVPFCEVVKGKGAGKGGRTSRLVDRLLDLKLGASEVDRDFEAVDLEEVDFAGVATSKIVLSPFAVAFPALLARQFCLHSLSALMSWWSFQNSAAFW